MPHLLPLSRIFSVNFAAKREFNLARIARTKQQSNQGHINTLALLYTIGCVLILSYGETRAASWDESAALSLNRHHEAITFCASLSTHNFCNIIFSIYTISYLGHTPARRVKNHRLDRNGFFAVNHQ
jgi:hypothetical protein